MEFSKAKKIIENEMSDSIVVAAATLRDGFLFSIKPKSDDSTRILMDPYFKVDNKGVVTEYSPVMNPEEFKEAMNNIVYRAELDGDSSLAHHGILGQKWGVRRFQNKDGSLTAAGKKRRDTLLKQLEEVGGTEKREAEKFDEAGKSTQKTVDEIRAETEYLRADNDYRRAVNDQLNLRKQYSDLTRPAPGPRKKTASEKVQEVLDPLTRIYNFPPIKNIGDGVSRSAVIKINELLGITEPKSYDKLLKSVSDQRKYEIERALMARYREEGALKSYADQYYINELDKVTPGKGGGKGNKGLSDDDLDKLIKRLRDEGIV